MSNKKIDSAQDINLKHIAIICDGNRSWSRQKGLSVLKGHEHAVRQIMANLVDKAIELELEFLTFWVFSTENWKRSQQEVDGLMNLFRLIFDEKVQDLHRKEVRVRVIGDTKKLADDLQERIAKGLDLTKKNQGLTVTFAINYGGRDEVVRAVRRVIKEVRTGQLLPSDLDEATFAKFLDTADIPDPDLIIRTSGEQRLSGFMSWQQQYAEFYFPKTFFPDFDGQELEKAVAEFGRRKRRFGG